MKRTRKDMIDLVNETVDYYNGDPKLRGVKYTELGSQLGCLYQGKGNSKCAVGRCMTKRALDIFGKSGYPVTRLNWIREEENKTFDTLLYKRYQGFSINLWVELQHLHDKKVHWNKEGLTLAGEKRKIKIINLIKEGKYDN